MFGHAVPMPVVVKTRTYDEEFYTAMGAVSDKEKVAVARKASEAVFGE